MAALQPQGLMDNQRPLVMALGNMQQAVDAAGMRVQKITDETFNKMREALNQSEANNRTLAERNAQMAVEISILRQQNKDLSGQVADQKKAQEACKKAEQMRIQAVATTARAECEKIIKYTHDKTKEKADTRHASPFTARNFTEHNEEMVSGMSKLLEHGRNIQAQIYLLEKPF